MDNDQKERNNSQVNIKIKNMKMGFIIPLILLIVLVVLGGIFGSSLLLEPKNEAEVITTSKLEKIIDISELNTFQAVYNGIAKVMNDKKPEKLDYYVSYKSKIDVGFNFKDIVITKDETNKKIIVIIPEIKITDVIVDIGSLDYMFQNDKANKSSVSEQAYKACIEDATSKSQEESAIYELAETNAMNIIEALIKPFIEDFDPEYKLDIIKGGM